MHSELHQELNEAFEVERGQLAVLRGRAISLYEIFVDCSEHLHDKLLRHLQGINLEVFEQSHHLADVDDLILFVQIFESLVVLIDWAC